jgi:hypothetical protein
MSDGDKGEDTMAISRKGRLNCLEKLSDLRQICERITGVHTLTRDQESCEA